MNLAESTEKTAGDSRTGLKALKSYLWLLQGQRRDLAIAIFLMMGSTTVSLAIPLFAGRLVDRLAGESGFRPGVPAVVGLGILLLLQLTATFLFTVVSARLDLRTVTRLRGKLFAHLLELPALFFTEQKAGDLSTRVTSDVGSIQYILTGGLITLLRAILTLVGALVLMLQLNTRLTLVVLLLIPATIGLVRIFGMRLRKLSRRMYDELGRISSHVQETVGSIRSLKVYNNQNHEQRRFLTMIGDYQSAGLKRAWLSAALESGIQISLWVCLIAVVVYGFTLAARGETTSGQLVAFLLLAFRVALPLSALTTLFSSAQGAIAAAGRLDDIFAMEPERIPDSPVPTPVHDPAALQLADVSFRYPGTPEGEWVLSGLNLEIAPGQWVGLVGPSGGGKTTLAGLVMGLFKPTSGSLTMDGSDYREIEVSRLRSRMAFVAQDPILYDMSLADNIRFGMTSATVEEVELAARRARVLEFADRLPERLETVCGERGVKLSGGQGQRVALARAFLRNPGILVLDEPTSALDAASEEAVRASMRELMADRTTLVIAHRLSLVRDLDLILVLAEGKIAERGTHEQLMSSGGMYRSLYDMQQGRGEETKGIRRN